VKPRYRIKAGRLVPTAEIVRVVQIPDAHDSPKLPDKSRFEWIGKYIAERQPDYIVDIGDSLDCESLCQHVPDETLTGRAKPSFIADISSYDKAMDALFTPIARVGQYAPVIKKCRGNHEQRIWKIEDYSPHAAGMYQSLYQEVLDRYGIVEHGYGEYVDISGVDAVHAPLTKMGKPRGGDNAATLIARKATRDLIIGHTHNSQQRCEQKDGPDRRVRIFETGTALPHGFIQPYVGHSQSGWHWCINEFLIINGRIEGWRSVSMIELEQLFGKNQRVGRVL
jgi:hypothetical protein